MAGRSRPKRAKVRGEQPKAHFASGLAEIVSETVRLWREHHLAYDQTKYVVEQARRVYRNKPISPLLSPANRNAPGFQLLSAG
jgi:hypothetical protein